MRIRICAGDSALDGALNGAAKHTDLVADLRCPVVIGRGAETDVLRTALGAAEGGLGSAVFLVGEAGIGKSRLAAELAAEARARGAVVLAGRAVPAGSASPYRPLTEALLQALRSAPYPADDALAPWRAALRAIIPPLDGAEEQDDGKVAGGDVFSRGTRGGRAAAAAAAGPSGPHPAARAGRPALGGSGHAGCSGVPERQPGRGAGPVRDHLPGPAGLAGVSELMARLHARRAIARIMLGRLSAAEVATMVRACLPAAADDVIARVQRHADGIPFLVEESLAAPGVPSSFADGVRVRLAA